MKWNINLYTVHRLLYMNRITAIDQMRIFLLKLSIVGTVLVELFELSRVRY